MVSSSRLAQYASTLELHCSFVFVPIKFFGILKYSVAAIFIAMGRGARLPLARYSFHTKCCFKRTCQRPPCHLRTYPAWQRYLLYHCNHTLQKKERRKEKKTMCGIHASRALLQPLMSIIKSESSSVLLEVDLCKRPNEPRKFRCEPKHGSCVQEIVTVY